MLFSDFLDLDFFDRLEIFFLDLEDFLVEAVGISALAMVRFSFTLRSLDDKSSISFPLWDILMVLFDLRERRFDLDLLGLRADFDLVDRGILWVGASDDDFSKVTVLPLIGLQQTCPGGQLPEHSTGSGSYPGGQLHFLSDMIV